MLVEELDPDGPWGPAGPEGPGGPGTGTGTNGVACGAGAGVVSS